MELYIALFQVYLVQFGYMSPESMRSESYVNQNAASKALTDFQKFVGLQPTGMLGLRWVGYVVCMGGLKARAEVNIEHLQREITLEAIGI
jgi:Putative peptidoglycan binding domain.